MEEHIAKAKRIADEDIYLNEDRAAKPKEYFKFVSSIVDGHAPLDGKDVLDVGCATGEFIHYLRSKYRDVRFTGMDVSQPLLDEARTRMPMVSWVRRDIITVPYVSETQYDVVFCLGVLQAFDNVEIPINSLLSCVGKGGSLYILGSFNRHQVDVVMRYRTTSDGEYSDWQLGWNLFSLETYERVLRQRPDIRWTWHDFRMPFAIPKTADVMRTWTIPMEDNPFQLVNGASMFFDIKVLEIHRSA